MHQRKEALLGIGTTAYFVWQDDKGKIHEEPMNPEGELYLFIIPPEVPHAVVNKSPHEPAILYEYFDSPDTAITKVELIQPLDNL